MKKYITTHEQLKAGKEVLKKLQELTQKLRSL